LLWWISLAFSYPSLLLVLPTFTTNNCTGSDAAAPLETTSKKPTWPGKWTGGVVALRDGGAEIWCAFGLEADMECWAW
jgi:hypothetical protein